MATKPPTTTTTINTNTSVASKYLDPKNAGPFALTVMVFVLYVMCFTSLYNPHLELVGYGLFFVLHMIMSGGIIKSGIDKDPMHPSTIDINKISIDPMKQFDLYTNLYNFFITNIFPSGSNSFIKSFFQIPFILLLCLIGFILLTILFVLLLGLFLATVPFKAILLMGKPFGLSGQVPISWSIMIGLLFLFISFIMLLITFVKVHAKHSAMNAPTMPKFLAGGNGEVKSGYTFKKGPQGTGYYLVDGVDFFFNDKKTQKNVNSFKIISITTTVLIWVQYLANKMVDNKTIENSSIINGMFALNGITIVSLSSVCIWITQQIGSRTGAIRSPPSLK